MYAYLFKQLSRTSGASYLRRLGEGLAMRAMAFCVWCTAVWMTAVGIANDATT